MADQTYTIQLPDGRKLDIQAADQATAVRGAQTWAAANPKKRDPTLGEDIGAAWNAGLSAIQRGARVQNGQVPAPDFNPIHWAQDFADNTAGLGGVVQAATAPVTATIKHYIGRPIAQGIVGATEAVGLPTSDINDPFHPRTLTHDQAIEQWVGNLATATSAAAPETGVIPPSRLNFMGPPVTRAAAAAPRAAAARTGGLADNVNAFDRAGVTPTLAATGGPQAASAAKFAAEDPVVGGVPQRRLQTSITETGQAADRVAAGYGSPSSPQAAGQAVQGGARRFAQDANAGVGPTQQTSFATKAKTLYDQAFARIPNGVVRPTNAQTVMQDILSRISAPSVANLLTNPTVKSLAAATSADAGKVTFSDLRAMRTWVRNAQADPELRQGIPQADLQRLESALTQDIYSSAQGLAGGSPYPTRALQQVDRFYAAGMARIQKALQPFADASSPEAAYDRLIAAAQAGGRADVTRLLGVKRSLQPAEWGDIAATALKRMGQPNAGAVGTVGNPDAFSIGNFVSNYNRLSPAGREILFGAKGGGGAAATSLRAQLDNLARVADMQKGVEAAANASRSAIGVRGAGTLVGLTNIHTLAPTIAALGGIRGLGEAMTNPAFVRWLAGTARSPATAAGARVSALQALAKGDPAIAAIERPITLGLISSANRTPQPQPEPTSPAAP